MTKMAATLIYGKNLLQIFFSRTSRPVTLRLGMEHWEYGAYQVYANDEPKMTLTYLTSWSNLLPNAFDGNFLKSWYFEYNWSQSH